MIEAVWYGLIAAFSFIGFVSAVCLTVLYLYKPNGNGRYIITLSESNTLHETERQICGAHLRQLIFGDLIWDEIIIVTDESSTENERSVSQLAAEYGIKCVSGKENDGSGAC